MTMYRKMSKVLRPDRKPSSLLLNVGRWHGWDTFFRTSYCERKTIDYVRSKVKNLVSRQESRFATIKCGEMAWFGHVLLHLLL